MKLRQLQELDKDNPNPEIAVKYLVEKGMQPHIAAGLVGNLMQESYMLENVWAKGNVDDKGSYGIMQWHGDRLKNLYNFEREKYNPEYKDSEKISLQHQLDYILEVDSKRKVKAADGTMTDYEIKNYNNAYSQPNAEKAALAFSNKVIRPHKDYAHNDKRVRYSKNLYDTYLNNEAKKKLRTPVDSSLEGNSILEFDGGGSYPNMSKDLIGFREALSKKFPKLRYTSGYREGAKTASGVASRHSKGEAWDIENNPEVYDYLWNTLEGAKLMNDFGVGVKDETDPETMKRTGATGAHFHIGKDSTLAPLAQKRYQELLLKQTKGKKQDVPSLATTSFNGNVNYATLPQGTETKDKKQKPLTEKEVRKILKEEQEKLLKQKEQSFLQKYQEQFKKQNPQEQQEVEPQQSQQDLSYLYNYIDQNDNYVGQQDDSFYLNK